jgi:uncharacterized protein (DUF1015 family)
VATLVPLGLRLVARAWVDRVPAPAHDALTPHERRRYIADHPDTYLTVTRSPEDVAPGERWDEERALTESRTALERLVDLGAFDPVAPPSLYLYRLAQSDHAQVGIVGGVAVADYEHGVIRAHEQVSPDRVGHLETQMAAVGVQSSPIALAHRPSETVSEVAHRIMDRTDPVLDFTGGDGVRQQIWPVLTDDGEVLVRALADAALYLIDGHHRAAATARLRASGSRGARWMLGAVFSTADLRNEAFHRRLPGIDGDRLVAEVSRRFPVRWVDTVDAVLARRPEETPLLTAAAEGSPRWCLVELPEVAADTLDPAHWQPPDRTPGGDDTGGPDHSDVDGAAHLLARLEPVRLQHHVLEPIVQAGGSPGDGERSGPGVEWAHGRGDRADLEALAATVSEPVWIMRPIPLETIMTASDTGAILPPKSTYFRPKVRSGVFLRSFQ